VFVACDHIGGDDSSRPSDRCELTLENLCAANAATVADAHTWLRMVLSTASMPSHPDTVLGPGQSMVGALDDPAQGQHDPFDGVGILGFSAFHTRLALPPAHLRQRMPEPTRGTPQQSWPYTGDYTGDPIDRPATRAELPARTRGFHFDDDPDDIVLSPIWSTTRSAGSLSRAGAERWCRVRGSPESAGVVAPEASLIEVPGWSRTANATCALTLPRADGYESSRDVTTYIRRARHTCTLFRATREPFGCRIHSGGRFAAMRLAVGATR